MNLSQSFLFRRRGLVAPILAVFLGALVWWFAWMAPTGSHLASAEVARRSDTAAITALQQRLVQLRADARNETAAKDFVRRFGRAIPPLADAPELVSQVYALALRSGVKLQAITDDTVVRAGSNYSAVPVSLTVAGSQDSIVAFVDGMYRLPRLLTVQKLQLSGPSSGDVITGFGGTDIATIEATAYTTSLALSPGGAATTSAG